MGHTVCFEAGRFTQTQSSATALCCSRKWMSGPADAWAQFVTDRPRQIEGQFDGLATALQETLPSAGRVLFPLDKPLSWMSPVSPVSPVSRLSPVSRFSGFPVPVSRFPVSPGFRPRFPVPRHVFGHSESRQDRSPRADSRKRPRL
jgi:hypothetical protein